MNTVDSQALLSVQFQFPRLELARALAREMLGRAEYAGLAPLPASGTFLSAPRRVGKSTFLRNDLVPVLKAEGVEVVYVDLWEDRSKEPAQLLAGALQQALRAHEGLLSKTAKAAGLSKITALSTFSFDLDKAGERKAGASLTQVLTQLADKAKAGKVALIIDEAQQALDSEAGQVAMFALKAARDALNAGPAQPRLMLLCTGSSRSKLSALVSGKESPFLGAKVQDFPSLGQAFTQAYTEFVNAKLIKPMRLDPQAMHEAFEMVAHRPEALFFATGVAIARAGAGAGSSSQALLAQAKVAQDEVLLSLQQQFDALAPRQQAVLLVLIDAGDTFSPFNKSSLEAYAARVGSKVSVTGAQSALDALVQKGILWQARRGAYALDDPLWVDWRQATPQS